MSRDPIALYRLDGKSAAVFPSNKYAVMAAEQSSVALLFCSGRATLREGISIGVKRVQVLVHFTLHPPQCEVALFFLLSLYLLSIIGPFYTTSATVRGSALFSLVVIPAKYHMPSNNGLIYAVDGY